MTKIGRIMVKEVITVEPPETVKTTVRLMNKNKIGCLVVVEDKKPIGIVTERDMLDRVLMLGKDPEETKACDVMTKTLVVGKPDMEITEAARLMFKSRIKKLPIVEKGCLIGIVTLTDLVRSEEEFAEMLRALCTVLQTTPKNMKNVLAPLIRMTGPIDTYTRPLDQTS